jgi:hypothetical protein
VQVLSFSLLRRELLLRTSSQEQDDCPCIIECWCFVSLPLSILKLQKLHLLNYSDVTQESIVITLFILTYNICDVLCIITSVMTPCNNPWL